MQNKFGLANTLALTGAILWVICALFVVIFPGLAYNITGWWLHGLELNPLGYWSMTFDGFIMGGVALVISAWISGLVFDWASEFLKNKKRG